MPVITYSKTFVVVFLLLFPSNPESVLVSKAGQGEQGGESPGITVKTQNTKLDESDFPPSNEDDKNIKFKEEKSEPRMQLNAGDKVQNTKTEESVNLPQTVDSNQKQNPKEEKINRKINLNDVNSYTAKENSIIGRKRETRYAEFLGLPRDSSYFFDDLEPFINNNSDYRVGRAAPSRDTKNQRSKVSGKGKENIENDVDDDDEDTDVEEEEKVNEDDYDDEDEMDSDCPPTTVVCTPTTACAPSTTTCRTTKRTTEYRPSTCRTTTEDKCATTKCPRICAKANRKNMGYPITTEKTVDWDADKKKLNNKRKKIHGRNVNL